MGKASMRKWMMRAARAARPDLVFDRVSHPGVRLAALHMRLRERRRRKFWRLMAALSAAGTYLGRAEAVPLAW